MQQYTRTSAIAPVRKYLRYIPNSILAVKEAADRTVFTVCTELRLSPNITGIDKAIAYAKAEVNALVQAGFSVIDREEGVALVKEQHPTASISTVDVPETTFLKSSTTDKVVTVTILCYTDELQLC